MCSPNTKRSLWKEQYKGCFDVPLAGVPVGHIWKFDLEEHDIRGFGMKLNFSKIRIEPVMLSFLATTEKIKKKSERPSGNSGKVTEKTAGNCYSQFPRL